MTENDRLLRKLLTRIHQHGYYHQIDIALVDLFTSNINVKEASTKHFVTPDAIYQHKGRLRKQEAS